jgi:hypothetical protein
VLLRALRDFNLGKLTSDDTSIFLGLLNDLFPKTLELVPRAVEKDFEAKVNTTPCFSSGLRRQWHKQKQGCCVHDSLCMFAMADKPATPSLAPSAGLSRVTFD